MSRHGEEIIERLPDTSGLKKPDNPFRHLINHGVGEWLDNYEDTEFLEMFFLNDATGKWLDLHGKDYGVTRQKDESDEHYRKRIILMSWGHLTINYLLNVYDLTLYTNIDGFTLTNNTLASDNPFLCNNDLLIVCSEEIKSLLESKFIMDKEITWLTV